MRFTAIRAGHADLPVAVQVAGLHNVRNTLAAIAIAQDLGVAHEAIASALKNFGGVGRRFQRFGEVTHHAAKFELIDDYGHHPVELKTTLAAARAAFPDRRLVLAFQPHRYTRTRDLFEDFTSVLSEVDMLLLAEVYAAGESPIPAADGRALARAIRLRGRVEPLFVEDVAEIPENVLRIVRNGDVVMTMGAGSIGTTAQKIVQASSGGAHVV